MLTSISSKQQKLNDFYRKQIDAIQIPYSDKLEVLKGLQFYDWSDNSSHHTFNHVIGLPQKNGVEHPLYDYEQMLFDALFQSKYHWIKKAAGLGISELYLRIMAWLCLRDDTYKGCQMCIVVGPNIEKAIELIDRMKKLFLPKLGVLFNTKETVIELNGVHIEAYPSHHLDAMRGLTRPVFILIDEADFFPDYQQKEAVDVSSRYIAKSDPWIVMISTPNKPAGLFQRIEEEEEKKCLYRRWFLDYTYGVGKIYTQTEIQKAKASPSFEREYNLKYAGIEGNVLHTKDIEEAIKKGENYLLYEANPYSAKSVGIDPSPGAAGFGICITELVDGIINVVYAEEIAEPGYDEMIPLVADLLQRYNIRFQNECNVFIDGANPGFIKALKQRVGDPIVDYEEQITRWKKSNPKVGASIVESKEWLIPNMFVIPVPFSTSHRQMLEHVKLCFEYERGMIAINKGHSKLITACNTAVEKDGKLDKDATSFDDLFDSFRLSMQRWAIN